MPEHTYSPVIPFLRYADPTAAVEFLVSAFGFERFDIVTAPDGAVVHAELSYGPATVQLGGASPQGRLAMDSPRQLPLTSQGVYVCVSDSDAEVDAHFTQAVAAGAEVLWEPHDTSYGARDYAVKDLEGHIWSFGTYLPGRTTG